MKKSSLAFLILASTAGTISSGHCRADDRIQGTGNFATSIQGSGKAQIEVRNLTGFNKVVADGAVNVEIVAQKGFGVAVEADENLLPILKTEVSGDTLKIYSTNSYSPKTRINVRISLPEIEGLELSGSSTATIANIKAESFELRAGGSAKIKVDGDANFLSVDASGSSMIDAEKLRVVNAKVDVSGASQAIVSATATIANVKAHSLELKAGGSAKIKVDGDANFLSVDASGSSMIDAEKLRVVNAKVEAADASQAIVSVTDELDANASGASRIFYIGKPKNLKQNTSGASSINQKST